MRFFYFPILSCCLILMSGCSDGGDRDAMGVTPVRHYMKAEQYPEAFLAAKDLFNQCAEFESDRCLVYLNYYLGSATLLLTDLNQKGEYSELYTYAQLFDTGVERIPDLEFVHMRLARSDHPLLLPYRDQEQMFQRMLNNNHYFLTLYFIYNGNLLEAQRHFSVLQSRAPQYASEITELLDYAQELAADPQGYSLMASLKALHLKLEEMIVLAHSLQPFMDVLALSSSDDTQTLRQELKDMMPRILEQLFQDEQALNTIYSGLVSSADIDESIRDDGLTLLKEDDWRNLFRCSFVNLLGKLINQARGLDIRMVITNDKRRLEFLNYPDAPVQPLHAKDRPSHILGLRKLDQDRYAFVDFINGHIHEPFSLKDDYTSNGRGYYQLARPEQREDLYRHFYLFSDEDIPAMVFAVLGKALEGQPVYEESAKALYSQTLRIWPDCFQCYLAFAAMSGYDSKEYEGYIEKSREIYPRNPDVYLNKMMYYYFLEHYEKGVAAGRQSLLLDEHNLMAYFWVGRGLIALQRYEEAQGVYQQAVALDPADPQPYEGLGRVFHLREEFEKSRTYFQKAYALYQAEGRFEEAQAILVLME